MNGNVEGKGGVIELWADLIDLSGTTVSSTVKGGSETGGFIDVWTPELLMSGSSIQSKSEGSGGAGNIALHTVKATVTEGSEISSSATGTGNAGSVTIEGMADNTLAQQINILDSGLTTEAFEGQGGFIDLLADRIELSGAEVSSTELDGEKPGGNINLTSGNLFLSDATKNASESKGRGIAGNIYINFTDDFLTYSSLISTDAKLSDGGNINIDGGYLMFLRDDSAITTTVGTGDGTGGNIGIQSRFVILDSSDILANAFGGPGGNIFIQAAAFIPSGDSLVEAIGKESQIPGLIVVQAPDSSFLKSLSPLPAEFEDPSSKLGNRCSQRRDVDKSTFSTAVRDGMPLGPEANLLGIGMASDIGKRDSANHDWEAFQINPSLLVQAGFASISCQ